MKIETKCPKCGDVTLHSVITLRVRILHNKHFHTTQFHCLLCGEHHYKVIVLRQRPSWLSDNFSPSKNKEP